MKSFLNRLVAAARRLSNETKARYMQAFVNALRIVWEIIRFTYQGGFGGLPPLGHV